MEVAPFFVDFHHFYRFSRFTHFCRDLHFVAIYALFPQIFFGQNSLTASSHVLCMYALNIGPTLEFCDEHLVICRSISIRSSFFFISEHKCWRVEHKVYFLRDNNYQSYLGLGTKKFKISVTIESGILLCNSCHFGVHSTHFFY